MCPPKKSILARNMIEPFQHQFEKGGEVLPLHQNIPKEMLKQNDPDRVSARLQVGEIVIPKKHSSLVSSFLKKKGIRLPNM